MESNFNHENFERLLRESSDQYRMYPSESVWKNIYSTLHTRRRWFGIGFILLLSAGFVTTMMMTNSAATTAQVQPKSGTKIAEATLTENQPDERILMRNSGDVAASSIRPAAPFEIRQHPIELNNNFSENTTFGDNFSNVVENGVSEIGSPIVDSNDAGVVNTIGGLLDHTAEVTELVRTETAPGPQVLITDAVIDKDFWISSKGRLLSPEAAPKKEIFSLKSGNYQPFTIESVINSYRRRNKKLTFQYYFTPTISYRKLSENKSSVRSSSAAGGSVYSNINNAVTHKPDMGLEVGAAAKYAVGKNFRVRAGLQFNTSRYDIKAFRYASELTTIPLNNGPSGADSVNTISSYRNFNGYKSDWLHNFYFQISAPVGIEVKLAGDDKIQFGIASTFQPTYVLGDRAYLLSSNYKNYAEVPWLMRRWNMNASFEAFVSYSTGKMNWQVGPQIRYQLQSSFVKEYPVKENLFDFGLKIGVSANK